MCCALTCPWLPTVRLHLFWLGRDDADDEGLWLGGDEFDFGTGIANHGRKAVSNDEDGYGQQPFLMARK